MEINIYCDESNHLENDDSNIMTIGAVYLEKDLVRKTNEDIRLIKIKNNIPITEELKWTRITKGRLQVYEDLINYFFDNDSLNSRTIIIPNKEGLDHDRFAQTHDDWYYKMYYYLLRNICEFDHSYNIYLDYKDTNMYYKGQELHGVLNNKFKNSPNIKIKKIQPIRSHEIEIMQIVDIIIGAIAYKNKQLDTSESKLKIVDLFEKRANTDLLYDSAYNNRKLNRFVWDMAGDSRGL